MKNFSTASASALACQGKKKTAKCGIKKQATDRGWATDYMREKVLFSRVNPRAIALVPCCLLLPAFQALVRPQTDELSVQSFKADCLGAPTISFGLRSTCRSSAVDHLIVVFQDDFLQHNEFELSSWIATFVGKQALWEADLDSSVTRV